MDKSFNIFISAFIAIAMYLLIILAFMLYSQTPIVKKYQSLTQDTIIQLDIIVNNDNTKDTKVKQKHNDVKVKDIKVEKSFSKSANKKTNLKSLFAKVSTKSTIIKEKKALNVSKNLTSSRFKSSYKKTKDKSDLKISKLNDLKTTASKKVISTKNNDNYDKYYSKINTYILSRWYKYPLFTNDEYLVKVKINITNQGVFSYNILSYSGNLNVDNAVKEFLKLQKNEIYPLPLDNKEKNIIINFINDKE